MFGPRGLEEGFSLTAAQAERLEQALGRLPAREADILRLRYLRTRTFQQIGAAFVMHHGRAMQLRARALRTLRRDLQAVEVAKEVGLEKR